MSTIEPWIGLGRFLNLMIMISPFGGDKSNTAQVQMSGTPNYVILLLQKVFQYMLIFKKSKSLIVLYDWAIPNGPKFIKYLRTYVLN